VLILKNITMKEKISEISLKLESREVKTEVRKLPVRKNFFNRLPRKLKKKIKRSLKGVKNYAEWLNESIQYIIGEPIFGYHKDCEKKIVEQLMKEIYNKKSQKHGK
jgi:hypothetical protein